MSIKHKYKKEKPVLAECFSCGGEGGRERKKRKATDISMKDWGRLMDTDSRVMVAGGEGKWGTG